MKTLEERVTELESRVGWLERIVKEIIDALKSAAGQLRNVGNKGENEK